MKFVNEPPNWCGLKPIEPDVPQPPSDFFGIKLQWPGTLEVPPVFISQFEIGSAGLTRIDPVLQSQVLLFLFGFRFNIRDATDAPESLLDGHFIVYSVVEYRDEEVFAQHTLRQTESVTYSSHPEENDYVIAESVIKDSSNVLCSLPNWKPSEAYWPLLNGNPMPMFGYASLPENDVTREFLTWDEYVFLFGGTSQGILVLKITTQPLDFQTLAEHYTTEEE